MRIYPRSYVIWEQQIEIGSDHNTLVGKYADTTKCCQGSEAAGRANSHLFFIEMESGNGWGNGGRFLNMKHVHKSSAEDRMSVRPADDELPQCPGPVTQ